MSELIEYLKDEPFNFGVVLANASTTVLRLKRTSRLYQIFQTYESASTQIHYAYYPEKVRSEKMLIGLDMLYPYLENIGNHVSYIGLIDYSFLNEFGMHNKDLEFMKEFLVNSILRAGKIGTIMGVIDKYSIRRESDESYFSAHDIVEKLKPFETIYKIANIFADTSGNDAQKILKILEFLDASKAQITKFKHLNDLPIYDSDFKDEEGNPDIGVVLDLI